MCASQNLQKLQNLPKAQNERELICVSESSCFTPEFRSTGKIVQFPFNSTDYSNYRLIVFQKEFSLKQNKNYRKMW